MNRVPLPALRPFVQTLWASASAPTAERERVLPTGAMHLVLRLSDTPLRVYADARDPIGRTIGCAVIGGARATAYIRDVSQPVVSVGAMLRPGAAELLFNVPAHALAECHTTLDAVWGRAAAEFRDEIRAEASLAAQLAKFEALLAARLPRIRGIDPVVAHALARFAMTTDVAAVVAETGYSHRHFIEQFRRGVGLSPKVYCRVQRFQRAIVAAPSLAWADVAADAGYSDQPHLVRDFRAIAGMTPSRYRAVAPGSRHVPI